MEQKSPLLADRLWVPECLVLGSLFPTVLPPAVITQLDLPCGPHGGTGEFSVVLCLAAADLPEVPGLPDGALQ